jgi:hypothetical protein
MGSLNNRLDRLEQARAPERIYIRMQPDESAEQAQAHWLMEHPDREGDLERAQVRFMRRVFVDAERRPAMGSLNNRLGAALGGATGGET